MFKKKFTFPIPPAPKQHHTNSKSELLTWAEALEYVFMYQGHIVSITGFWAKFKEPQKSIDLDHLWDLNRNRVKAKDWLSRTHGLVDYYVITT